ncbi:tripartite tricarboxylate transporter substrate binding protein [Bordetella sp. BOR01]|uniref:Bug family tripartite tricarboxylate transporter substrate binding protein n=1 Tax=Bordetella sp. BOR01 TaxID=2854779 RepID=UPI001C461CBE|nr:tripartite tricarboxylate transporter substrate binding protein [Bordetella sp. BOR01]MBV7485103.1 tripartite tricarboxylate transporter substrate binding protein [Bordetella sp. BOR01]
MKFKFWSAAAALAFSAASGSANAAYPDRAVTLVVPYAPGGTTDLMARVVAPKLGEVLGQTVVVVNKPGAGGAVGSGYAARERPDGYTLVMAVESSHAVNPSVHAKSPYDPIKDFAPISNLANVLGVLDVPGDSGIKTFDQLVADLKAHPDRYSFGSSGSGGYSHLFGELFLSATGTKMLHVPYKGLGPALVGLMAGQVQVVFDNLPSSAGFLASGKLRALAVASPKRIATMPDVPTYAEVGYPQLNTPSWFGLAAPAGTPDAVLDKLNQAVKQVLADPKVIADIERLGAVPDYMSREQFAATIERSNAVWQKVVNDIGFEKL